jgi:hypothetical protein
MAMKKTRGIGKYAAALQLSVQTVWRSKITNLMLQQADAFTAAWHEMTVYWMRQLVTQQPALQCTVQSVTLDSAAKTKRIDLNIDASAR